MADNDNPDGDLNQKAWTSLIDAFKETSLEKDKSLLSISSAGIGLLVSLLSIDECILIAEKICYSIAFVGFMICILSVIYIFEKNKNYVEKIRDQDVSGIEEIEKKLQCGDLIAICSFGLAVIATVAIGIIQLI